MLVTRGHPRRGVMKHVLVETNWVVAYGAPAHLRVPQALEVEQKAMRGEPRLHVPSVALAEARHPIRTKFQPRGPAGAIRKFLAWGTAEGIIAGEDNSLVRGVLDQYESVVLTELRELETRLETLLIHPGVEVFSRNDDMLARAVARSTQSLDLKPFDQAILAAVLEELSVFVTPAEVRCASVNWTATFSLVTRTA